MSNKMKNIFKYILSFLVLIGSISLIIGFSIAIAGLAIHLLIIGGVAYAIYYLYQKMSGKLKNQNVY